jgi:hypothetical protein
MSTVISATRFVALLKEWGIPYVEHSYDGIKWYQHNRNQKGLFGDMHGSMIHHTGSNSQDPRQLWDGRADLPGPVCHGGIDDRGVVHLVGWGRANHAGLGSSRTLEHVIAEDYGAQTLRPGPADTDGNRCFYGWEVMYDGQQAMTDDQYRSTIRVQAMICTEHKWKPYSIIGHGEWQQGKWDPGYAGRLMNMDKIRGHIWQAMQEGPHPKLPPRPIPNPPTSGNPRPAPSNEVTVKPGDTLTSLAKNLLGDQNRWTDFITANPSLVRPLHVGEKLIVPKK